MQLAQPPHQPDTGATPVAQLDDESATPDSQYLEIPPKRLSSNRWSFLSSPPLELSLSSPEPEPSTPVAATARFSSSAASASPDARRSLSSTTELPESPSSPRLSAGPERRGFDVQGDDPRNSIAHSMRPDNSHDSSQNSLVDPRMSRWTAVIEREQQKAQDPSLMSLYLEESASDIRPMQSTPPRSPRSLRTLPQPTSFDIGGRPLPTAPPSADPRSAFPTAFLPPPPSPSRLSFRKLGALTAGARGKFSTSPEPDVGEEGLSWDCLADKLGSAPPRSPDRRRSTQPAIRRSHSPPTPLLLGQGISFPEPPNPRSLQPSYIPPARPPPAPSGVRGAVDRSNTLGGDASGSSSSSVERLGVSRVRANGTAELVPRHRASLVNLAELRRLGGGPTSPALSSTSPLQPLSTPPSSSQSSSPFSSYPPAFLDPGIGIDTPFLTPPSTKLSRNSLSSSSGFPFPAPKPPPKDPIPPVPSFTSVYIDPRTSTIPISLSAPLPPVPAPTERTLRHRVSDWILRKTSSAPSGESSRAESDGIVPLELLARRAEAVEARLATGMDSPPSAQGMKRRTKSAGRNEYSAGRFSIGRRSREADADAASRHSWSRIADEDGEGGEKARRRQAKRRKEIIEGRRKTQDWLSTVKPAPPATSVPRWRTLVAGPTHPPTLSLLSSRRFRILISVILTIIIVLAIVLGLTLRSHATSTIGSCRCDNGGIAHVKASACSCSCKGTWGGSFCQLDGTCSSLDGYSLANGLGTIADDANSNAFATSPINATRLALVVNEYVHLKPSAGSCTSQLSIIDLPNLAPTTFPTRLAWASQALLWSAFQTESNSTTLRAFAASRTFTSLGDAASAPNSNFQMLFGGHIFDFASMTVTAPSASWISLASPPADQIALVASSTIAGDVLDNLTSIAVAKSSQRSSALEHRWAELGLESANLARFRSAVQSAPIVIPFDATSSVVKGTSIMELAAAQTNSTSFPPAIGCRAGLSKLQVSEVNAVEVGAFGLSAVTTKQSLDRSCLERPLYGTLDLLSLRLPFSSNDTRSNLPLQGLVVNSTNAFRATLHAGELLVGALSGTTTLASAPSDVSDFGTFEYLDHVLLSYLNLLDPTVAQELVAFVLADSAGTPPSSSAALSTSLPLLEVQLWGGLRFSNIEYSISSLALPSDSTALFFGTSAAQSFRVWALQGASQGPIQWTLDPYETKVVRDSTVGTSKFSTSWNATAGGGTGNPAAVWKALLAAGLAA